MVTVGKEVVATFVFIPQDSAASQAFIFLASYLDCVCPPPLLLKTVILATTVVPWQWPVFL